MIEKMPPSIFLPSDLLIVRAVKWFRRPWGKTEKRCPLRPARAENCFQCPFLTVICRNGLKCLRNFRQNMLHAINPILTIHYFMRPLDLEALRWFAPPPPPPPLGGPVCSIQLKVASVNNFTTLYALTWGLELRCLLSWIQRDQWPRLKLPKLLLWLAFKMHSFFFAKALEPQDPNDWIQQITKTISLKGMSFGNHSHIGFIDHTQKS